MSEYNVANPHPGFSIDDNILNEYGHTKYPMWIDHPTEKEANGKPKRVIVKDKKEEAELLKFVSKQEEKKEEGYEEKKAAAWGSKAK